MAVGLGGDAAWAAVHGGARARAVSGFAEAIGALEGIDPEVALSHAFCHHAIRQAVVWAYSQVTGGRVSAKGYALALEAGDCSNPKPAAGLRERPLVHMDVVWYLLAETEMAAGVDAGIEVGLEDKLTGGRIPVMEAGLRGRRMEMAIAALDAKRFAAVMPSYYEMVRYTLREGGSGIGSKGTLLRPSRGQIPTWEGRRAPEREAEKVVEHALVGFGIYAAIAGKEDAVKELEGELRARYGNRYPGRALLESWERGEDRLTGLDRSAFAAVRAGAQGGYADPGVLWRAGMWFFMWMENSHFGRALWRQLGKWQRRRWREIAERERFRLSRPRHTVPGIERAIAATEEDGRSFVARLLLVTADAVGEGLDSECRRMLEEAGEA